MSTGMGGCGIPGIGSEISVAESELLWGAGQARNAVLSQGGVFSGAIRDAGNTPTTVIRPGLLVGKLDSNGKYEEWDADAADGTQNLAGVLDVELRAQDFNATNADRVYAVMVARAPLKARKLLIQGAALVGHVDEYLARRQLHYAGFVLDDDPFGYLTGLVPRFASVTGVTDTLTAAENGSFIAYSNAASVTVTLPAIKPGLEYTLIRTGDEEFIVASGEGDNVIAGNDLSADSVTFTTAGEHLGCTIRVRSIYVGTALKWLMDIVTVPLGVGLDAWTYSIAT